MNILYGIQTTGNGHISCARHIVHALKSVGHNVTCIFSGTGRSGFWDYSVFEPFYDRRGLTFVIDDGRLSMLKTALQLKPVQFIQDIRQLDLAAFDVVVSDFEPISAWAAKLQKKPSISISHQAAFDYDVPKSPGNYAARAVMRYFAPTQHRLGLHWHHFGHALLPPVIEPDLFKADVTDPRLILVCLPYENRQRVTDLLKKFKDYTYHFYTDTNSIEHDANVVLHPFGRASFVHDLQRCNGVVGHAGFELGSEALHLGKKLLVRPLAGQFEQECNAVALVKNGLGHATQHINAAALQSFLQAKNPSPKHYPRVDDAIAHWIGRADLDAPHAHWPLVEALWDTPPALAPTARYQAA